MGALIGRTAALTALGRLVDAAVNGAGGLAFVTGDAGIGKTAVADEARRQAIGRGAMVVWGTCTTVRGCRCTGRGRTAPPPLWTFRNA
jgi:predicted ATPase